MTGPPKDHFDSSNKSHYLDRNRNHSRSKQYSSHGQGYRESPIDKSEYSESQNQSVHTNNSKQYSVEDIEV